MTRVYVVVDDDDDDDDVVVDEDDEYVRVHVWDDESCGSRTGRGDSSQDEVQRELGDRDAKPVSTLLSVL
jgi:hypothetical protein